MRVAGKGLDLLVPRGQAYSTRCCTDTGQEGVAARGSLTSGGASTQTGAQLGASGWVRVEAEELTFIWTS